jgi:cation diffusion facilitator family transporter
MHDLQRLKVRFMLLSLGLSVVLTVLKFGAFYLTTSTAILTDALESIVNVIASGFALYSVFLSGRPRDLNHPYGHGKIEYVSSGFEGALILSAGLIIVFEAVMSFFTPKVFANLNWGLLLVGITALANAGVGRLLLINGKRTDSPTLTADGQHLLVDSLSSVIVLGGVALIWATGLTWLDGVLSLGLAGVIIFNGIQLVRRAISGLMDEADQPTIDRVVTLLQTNKDHNWIDVHNLRVQKYGADLHIDCHLTMPYYWDLSRTHDEVHQFEAVLEAGFQSEVEIFVHTDPCLFDCCHYCRVADCPVRAFPFVQDIDWTAANLTLNQKHFVPITV